MNERGTPGPKRLNVLDNNPIVKLNLPLCRELRRSHQFDRAGGQPSRRVPSLGMGLQNPFAPVRTWAAMILRPGDDVAAGLLGGSGSQLENRRAWNDQSPDGSYCVGG